MLREPFAVISTAIDVWMSMCLVFTFLSLIEYAIVNTNARHNTPVAIIPLPLALHGSFFRRDRNKNPVNHASHQVGNVDVFILQSQ